MTNTTDGNRPDTTSENSDLNTAAPGADDCESNRMMQRLDAEISHVWMVRAFLKHSDEATEDEELAEVHRDLYDYMLALGPALEKGDASGYLKMAWKKLRRLKRAAETFSEIQPEVSGHMNFQMANRSLQLAVAEIEAILNQHRSLNK